MLLKHSNYYTKRAHELVHATFYGLSNVFCDFLHNTVIKMLSKAKNGRRLPINYYRKLADFKLLAVWKTDKTPT